jgi:uncharacterized protein YegP (UPF0339 family)
MSQPSKDANALVAVYSERITEPSTNDEVYGYWLFVVGLIASVVGVALFLYTATLDRPPAAQGGTYWMLRETGVVLAAGGVPVMLGGVAVRLPLRRAATWLTLLGTVVCLAALVGFVIAYPAAWSTASGNPGVIGMYTAGLAVIALSSAFIPMLSRAETETESERGTRERREAELATTEAQLERTEEARDEARIERDEANVAADAAAAELESVRQSKARFELFEDRGGGHRWRLRHRNGNIIATSGESYASRQKCQQGMHSVMRNALGADVLLVEPDDPDVVAEEAEPEPIELESRASFELFEDAAGEWRWRLVHENGNVIADSGEGYASRGNAKRAMAGVREHAATADYLRIDPTGFEIYRDRAGEYRWRLVHRNGNVLADSGEGYASRQKARQGLESVRANAGDAEIEER